jgi:hypothetical protein
MTESRGSSNLQTWHLLEPVEYQSQGERKHNDGTSGKQRISWDLGDRRKDNRGGVVQWPLLVDRPRVLKHFSFGRKPASGTRRRGVVIEEDQVSAGGVASPLRWWSRSPTRHPRRRKYHVETHVQ